MCAISQGLSREINTHLYDTGVETIVVITAMADEVKEEETYTYPLEDA